MGGKGKMGGSIARKNWKRNQNYKHRYGVTLKEFEDKYQEQEGKCDCCKKKIPKSGSNKMALDHNHTSMKVRGILCPDCNMNLVATLENKDKLILGLKYLQKWEADYVKSLFCEIF